MPLLRAGGVRVGTKEKVRPSWHRVCLNALVAGGGSAGRAGQVPRGTTFVLVSMPLLRAGRRHRNEPALRAHVSMPLLRAGGVRVRPGSDSLLGAGCGSCLNALVAGGGSAGPHRNRRGATRRHASCLNALVAGGGSAGLDTVSMPLLLNADWTSTLVCLNALVAGGGSAGRRGGATFNGCLNALVAGGGSAGRLSKAFNCELSQCPCCGRGECGRGRRRTSSLSQCPCCGRGECGLTLASSGCLNALVAGGGSAG